MTERAGKDTLGVHGMPAPQRGPEGAGLKKFAEKC
jgi:hypothetical protein